MPEKKANHYFPKVLLRNWITLDENGRRGVHVFDIRKNKEYFSTAEGRKAFSFAISDNIYVPKINQRRYLKLEDWFGTLETSISKMLKILSSEQNVPLFKNPQDLYNLKLALLSFKHRSKYVIESNTKFVQENPDYIEMVWGRTDRDIKILMLENVVNATIHDALEYDEIEIVVGRSKNKSLICSDLPFLEKVVDNFSFIPLSNKKFIGFRPTDKDSTYNRVDFDIGMIDALNNPIATNARHWIIADSRELIDEYKQDAISSIEKSSVYTPARYLFKSVNFTDDDEKNDL